MTAPGTSVLVVDDATNKMRLEHRTVTIQSAPIHIVAGIEIQTAHATVNTFVADPVTISLVLDSDKRGVTAYSTGSAPLDVSILLIGYE